ncbi:MAG: beta-galactosidase [Clostridia bacterium]
MNEETRMVFGVDYYPEHWPEDRWSTDVRLMKEAGFNMVRLAEFTWSLLEPEEGCHDFRWLDKIIGMLHENGLGVMLCTPTAAPPEWLMHKHPEIYPTGLDGRVRGFGSRRHYCSNSAVFREYTEKIIQAMATRYRNHPAVMAWQLDNEFGCHDTVRCYCEDCAKGFGKWLEAKYGDIGVLNQQWGTVFWGQQYPSFDRVILPKPTICDAPKYGLFAHNPGLILDFFRFSSDSMVEYSDFQVRILRENGVTLPITHNFMAGFYDIDYFKLAEGLDFVSWDCYPHLTGANLDSYHEIAYQHDKIRGYKNMKFWITEMASGPLGWNIMSRTPNPGQLRLWTYQAVAHGADGILYFRWRPCLFGTEQYWHGVLDHDGIPRRRYQELKQTREELQKLQDVILQTDNDSQACIIHSFDNEWSHGYQPHSPGFSYNNLLFSMHYGLQKAGINCDVRDMQADLSAYRLVVFPAYNISSPEEAQKIREYVENGGTVVFTFRSGGRDSCNKITGETLPGYFRDLLGIDVIDYDALADARVPLDGLLPHSEASFWCDVIDPRASQVLSTYGSEYYAGSPCVTLNPYGKGRAVYIGFQTDPKTYANLFSHLYPDASFLEPCDAIETVRRKKGDESFAFLLNHSNNSLSLQVFCPFTDLATGKTHRKEIDLVPYDARIVRFL